MAALNHFTLIYNPDSTGNSPRLARDFAENIKRQLPAADVELRQTKRRGHAEELAYEAAKIKDNVIISVSGDGGYNEVVNGAIRAVNEGVGDPICAVLPGGNANDHYSSVHRRPLMKAILEGKPQRMDLLLLADGKRHRYAHSYIGLGMTPLVAAELNKHKLSRLKEFTLVCKTLWHMPTFEVVIDGERTQFDSLVMANIPRMAKYLKIAKNSSVHDGKFEVVMIPHTRRLGLVMNLLKSAQGKMAETSASNYAFTTVTRTPVQLDGEVMQLKKGVTAYVVLEYSKLRTIR